MNAYFIRAASGRRAAASKSTSQSGGIGVTLESTSLHTQKGFGARSPPLTSTHSVTPVSHGAVFVSCNRDDVLALRPEESGDEIWIYGVEPGGFAANGSDPKDALEAFRHSFANVLRDLAAECSQFVEFEAAVQSFFREINVPNERDWHPAVQAVRSVTSRSSAPKSTLPSLRSAGSASHERLHPHRHR